MKIFLAAVSGFILMLATFFGGALTAVFFVSAEPLPEPQFNLSAASVWTDKPVTIKAAPRDSTGADRPASEPSSTQQEPPQGFIVASAQAAETVDPMTTAATPDADSVGEEPEPAPLNSEAHTEWCYHRYRSYRHEDNSYRAYSGERRVCLSPYLDSADLAQSGSLAAEEGTYIEASAGPGEQSEIYMSSDHVQSCFDRYRSYDPTDNSYQPYGGGPRRQCE